MGRRGRIEPLLQLFRRADGAALVLGDPTLQANYHLNLLINEVRQLRRSPRHRRAVGLVGQTLDQPDGFLQTRNALGHLRDDPVNQRVRHVVHNGFLKVCRRFLVRRAGHLVIKNQYRGLPIVQDLVLTPDDVRKNVFEVPVADRHAVGRQDDLRSID